MKCNEIDEQDVLERYLLKRLSEAEQDAFEQHYFECNSCFERLQLAKAIQETDGVRDPSNRAGFSSVFLGLPRNSINAVTVITLLLAGIAFATWRYHVRDNQSTAQVLREQSRDIASSNVRATTSAVLSPIAELARIDPPPYTPVILRDSEDPASKRFQDAMRPYMRRDYASAIPGLRRVVDMDPKAANANFYLGVCYLFIDQADLAISSLKTTISLHDPNYVEEAHFYLAKAYIRKNDLAAAKSELERTVQLQGDREEEARKLEKRLTELIPTTQ